MKKYKSNNEIHEEMYFLFRNKYLDLRSKEKDLELEYKNYINENRSRLKLLMPKRGLLYSFKSKDSYLRKYRVNDWLQDNPDGCLYAKIISNSVRCDKLYGLYVKAQLIDIYGKIIDSLGSYYYIDELSEFPIVLNKSNKSATKIYLMIDKNTGYYKIGRSVNPKYRERTLQSEKPTIEMLFNYDGINDDEMTLHNMFSQKRIRGEWFDLSGTDITKIENYFKTKP